MPRRLPLMLAGSLLATAFSACTAAVAQDDAVRTVRIYDLLRAFPRAKVQAYAGYVSKGVFSVNEEARSGVFLHPAGSITFPPVRVSSDSVLTFKFGVADGAWDKEGDGVEFSVSVQRMSGATTHIFSQYVDPKHNADDRRWFEKKISLRQFGDQEVRIMLATLAGPADNYSYDWAVFAEPQIVLDSTN